MPRLHKLRSRRMPNAAALLAGCVALAPTVTSGAEGGPHHETMQERQACTLGVLRICRSLVPDRQAITDCLVANAEHLSPACREVVARRQ